ncbi:MAG: hemerythrin domain-containing protein [Proteobacteria bacterium]|nr:MAG: hemerythrin domain-containing protein [Pseudomonadota bacterium]
MKFNFLSIEPHSFDEIRMELDEAIGSTPDFIHFLKTHHDYLEESIEVLTDMKSSVTDKQEHLSRFLVLLDMHGHAEEETLYRRLVGDDLKDARVEGLGAQDEHDIAYLMGDELIAMDFTNTWSDQIESKAKVLATLVQNHIKEEESVMFKLASHQFDAVEFDKLSKDYVLKCAMYLEADLTPPPNAAELSATTRGYREF